MTESAGVDRWQQQGRPPARGSDLRSVPFRYAARDGIEQPATVTDPGDAEVLEIFQREAGQKLSGNGILVECRLVLAKIQRTQPVGNVHTASSNPTGERAKGGQASSRDNY